MNRSNSILLLIVAFILLLLVITGCKKSDLDYIPVVRIYKGVTGRELEHTKAFPPVDWFYYVPSDTIAISDSLINDTCTVFHQVNSPDFVNFVLNFDVEPDTIQWYYKNDPIDLGMFLLQYGSEVHIYYNGTLVGGTLKGNVSATQFQARIWARDGDGQKFYLTFADKSLYFEGALNFDQYWLNLHLFPSVKFLSFLNANYTCDEYGYILNYLLLDCKEAPTNGIIDLRFVSCTIDQELTDELIERGWTIW